MTFLCPVFCERAMNTSQKTDHHLSGDALASARPRASLDARLTRTAVPAAPRSEDPSTRSRQSPRRPRTPLLSLSILVSARGTEVVSSLALRAPPPSMPAYPHVVVAIPVREPASVCALENQGSGRKNTRMECPIALPVVRRARRRDRRHGSLFLHAQRQRPGGRGAQKASTY
jgi:hypothetical protein